LTGQWSYKIQAVASDPVLVEVWMPYGAGSVQDEVINVEGWTSWDNEKATASLNPAETPLVFYARVTVGQRAVRLAEVVAKVKRTTATYSDEFEAPLVDNGLGGRLVITPRFFFSSRLCLAYKICYRKSF
jgi:hypothetical protein